MKPLKLSKVVERAGADGRQPPALRRVRIDVVEVLEVGRVLEVAEDREAVARLRRRRPRPTPRSSAAATIVKRRHIAASRESSVMRSPYRHSLSAAERELLRLPLRRYHHTCWNEVARDGSLSPGGRTCPSRRRDRPARYQCGTTIVVPQQDAVERPGRGDEIVAVLGEDDLLDQLVDRRVLEAAWYCGCLACRPPPSPRSRAARCRASATAES